MLGDLFYFYLNDTERAIPVYEKGLSFFVKPEKSTMSPYRYFLKRLSNIYYDMDDKEKALKRYEAFFILEPSDFYASDFIKFADLLISFGFDDRAKDVLHIGVKTHPGELKLYNFAKEKFPNEVFPFKEKRRRGSIEGVEKILIKTPILKEGDDIYKTIDDFTKDIRKDGDIITIHPVLLQSVREDLLQLIQLLQVHLQNLFLNLFLIRICHLVVRHPLQTHMQWKLP